MFTRFLVVVAVAAALCGFGCTKVAEEGTKGAADEAAKAERAAGQIINLENTKIISGDIDVKTPEIDTDVGKTDADKGVLNEAKDAPMRIEPGSPGSETSEEELP